MPSIAKHKRRLARRRQVHTLRAGSASLGGGTHHANATQGSGYCVFNDVAVAARLMQAEWHRRHRALLQVAVIDLDVHQGNGTAAIFADDDTVFTFSMVTGVPYGMRELRQADAGRSHVLSKARCDNSRISALVSPASTSGAFTR